MIFIFDRVENIVGKEENAGYQHFLLFHQCFQKGLYIGSFKVKIVRETVKVESVSYQQQWSYQQQ